MARPIAIEICAGDVESAIAAEAGGADRVELCDNPAVGGTTPSLGTIAEACRWLTIPVHVLIRPRAGDFHYSDRERSVMRRDIEAAKALGAAGVVLGILDDRGEIDGARTAELIGLARPLSVTFHKAIDGVPDPLAAVDRLIELGVDRVLSSGGCSSAIEGAGTLRAMVERSEGRITIMAGGRLVSGQIDALVRSSGVPELHFGSAAARAVPARECKRPIVDDLAAWSRTDAARVRALVEASSRRTADSLS